MKLFRNPRAIVDLQVGDIVYMIVNGQITQARVADFSVVYDIHSNALSIVTERQYSHGEKKQTFYVFDLPDGTTILKTPKYRENTPDIYLSVEDARNDKKLEWQYGYYDTLFRGNKDNQSALDMLKQYMKESYGLDWHRGGYFLFYYNKKSTQQVTEVAFNCIYDENMGDIRISHGSSEYGFLGERIDDKKFFATRAECERAYQPKVVMFDELKVELPQDHYIVYKRFFENQEFANDELVGIYDNKNEAVAMASMRAYTDNNAIAGGLDSDYHCYIVFPCDKNGEGSMDNERFETPYYSSEPAA